MKPSPRNGTLHADRTSDQQKELRSKISRVAIVLESVLGTPVQAMLLPNPLDMLIATILSQNTNDKNSHRAYTELRRRYRRWQDVAVAPARSIVSAIRTGGMANQKALRIKETLVAVKGRFGTYDLTKLEGMESDRVLEELTAIRGVGVKTASCVLLFSMKRDVFPVDTHVQRICERLGLAPGCTTPEKTFHFMRRLVPKGKGYSFHTNCIRFGRRVCRSINPACSACPLYGECLFPARKQRRRLKGSPSTADHDFMLLDNVQVVR